MYAVFGTFGLLEAAQALRATRAVSKALQVIGFMAVLSIMLDGFYRVLASCGHNGFQTAF
ncbi:hypothetical protein l11_08630 [Neisseria weaveri LMG 5135]|nr:hypothetical protein l11_08630 [Neisseria weaveri LMG 5135]